jgi:hypothetical protein
LTTAVEASVKVKFPFKSHPYVIGEVVVENVPLPSIVKGLFVPPCNEKVYGPPVFTITAAETGAAPSKVITDKVRASLPDLTPECCSTLFMFHPQTQLKR